MQAFLYVSRFARELGWHGLEQTDITLTPDICGRFPVGTVVTCWSTNHLKFFIQINQFSPGSFGIYKISVVAERYDIRPMDFVKCEFDSTDSAIQEASRLSPLFARGNFKNRNWRRQYLEQHPNKLWRTKKSRGWKSRLGRH